jgi:hypothetical protein
VVDLETDHLSGFGAYDFGSLLFHSNWFMGGIGIIFL